MRIFSRRKNQYIAILVLGLSMSGVPIFSSAGEMNFDALNKQIAMHAIEVQKIYPCDRSMFRNWSEEVASDRQSMMSAFSEAQDIRNAIEEVYRLTGNSARNSIEQYKDAYSRFVRSRYCMQQAQQRIR